MASILHFKVLIGGVCLRDLDPLHMMSWYAVAPCLSKPLQSTNEDKKNQAFAKLLNNSLLVVMAPKEFYLMFYY